jgi:hypothetical protein
MVEGYPEATDQRSAEHDLWLAMQAAYNKYRNASEVLESLGLRLQVADPSAGAGLQIESAASEQRSAFENYIEARMQFAEFRCDQNGGIRSFAQPEAAGASAGRSAERRWWVHWPGIPRAAMAAIAAALLCTTALSLAFAVRERQHVRDSDAARDQANATLGQARDEIQVLTRNRDAFRAAQSAPRDSTGETGAPNQPPETTVTRAAESKQGEQSRWRRFQKPASSPQKRAGFARSREKLVHPVQSLGTRGYWTFTLPVSKQFQTVGPVRLSLRSVNLNHKYLELCVTSQGCRLQHVNLNEPVWIIVGDPLRRVELVFTHIYRNQVQGYLRELRYPRSELTASQVRRRPPGGS